MTVGADQVRTIPLGPTSRLWLAECPECPLVRDPDTGAMRPQQWFFDPDDLPAAKALAARHRSLHSHELTIVQLAAITARQDQVPADLWDHLIGLGDAGATQGIRL